MTDQDVETKKFDGLDFFTYLLERLPKNRNVVFLTFCENRLSEYTRNRNEEYAKMLVTRHWFDVYRFSDCYDGLGWTDQLVFEFPTYDAALKYMESYLECSSKMYDDNPAYDGCACLLYKQRKGLKVIGLNEKVDKGWTVLSPDINEDKAWAFYEQIVFDEKITGLTVNKMQARLKEWLSQNDG